MSVTNRAKGTGENQKQMRRISAALECLEGRQLLSSSSLADLQSIVVTPARHHSATAAAAAVTSSIDGYTPAQIRKAYGFDQITLPNGVKADGAGQTIAIVTAYNDPNLASDLKTFDARMGLDNPLSLSVVNQTGGKTSSLATDAGWAGETALDVEWAHAIAPAAKILVVAAKSATLGNLLSAVDYARHAAGVSVVSMSWGAGEFWSQSSFDHYFTTPSGHQGVTFVAASGDEGSWWGPSWPSSSSNVLAVGGTTLDLNGSNTAAGNETAWDGSGGGFSAVESAPSYQANVQRTGVRSAPDVSYDANPYTGFAFYNSVDDGSGYVGWQVVGGTSAGTPQWAALVAIANQGRAAVGKGSLDGATGTLPTLYSLYNDPAAYAKAFNDVTWGRSSFFTSARVGYDAVTGLGTPKAPGVVDALIGKLTPTSAVATTTTVASRRAKAQLVRRATPAATPPPDTTPVVAPAARPALQPSFDTSLLSTQTAATASTFSGESRDSSFGTTGTTLASARGAFSSRRVTAAFTAGYEPATPQPATPLALWSPTGSSHTPITTSAAANETGRPMILWDFMPLTPSAPEISAARTFPMAASPGIVQAAPIITGPRALLLATAAVVTEVVVLTYRRARRKAVPDAHHPIVEPLHHDDR